MVQQPVDRAFIERWWCSTGSTLCKCSIASAPSRADRCCAVSSVSAARNGSSVEAASWLAQSLGIGVQELGYEDQALHPLRPPETLV
jgi:hypothetical protein